MNNDIGRQTFIQKMIFMTFEFRTFLLSHFLLGRSRQFQGKELSIFNFYLHIIAIK